MECIFYSIPIYGGDEMKDSIWGTCMVTAHKGSNIEKTNYCPEGKRNKESYEKMESPVPWDFSK